MPEGGQSLPRFFIEHDLPDGFLKMPIAISPNAVAMILVGGLLAGCATSPRGGVEGTSRGLLSPKPSASASYIAALQGGIIARAPITISASDRSRALEAEYRALESVASGQTIPWKGSDASGEVIVAAPYQVGRQNCRQYRHTVMAAGREVVARGAACRNPDGTWTPLT